MWKFTILTVLLLGCDGNTHTTSKLVTLRVMLNQANTTSSPSICDTPSPTIEPEMCCDFPNFFDSSIVEKCEIDFALAEKSSANLITDSVKNLFN
jgi:hypothetical protein